MKKNVLLISLFLLFLSPIDADTIYYLDDYPNFFIQNKDRPLAFVVGEKAPASDVLALIQISSSLQSLANSKNFGTTIMDNELLKDINILNSYNIIAVGNPCENEIVEEFSSYKCRNVYELDKYAVVEIKNNNNHAVLLINAQYDEARRTAADVLGNYEDYDIFRGRELEGRRELFIKGPDGNPEFTFRLPELLEIEKEVEKNIKKQEQLETIAELESENYKPKLDEVKSDKKTEEGIGPVISTRIKEENEPGLIKRMWLWFVSLFQ